MDSLHWLKKLYCNNSTYILHGKIQGNRPDIILTDMGKSRDYFIYLQKRYLQENFLKDISLIVL